MILDGHIHIERKIEPGIYREEALAKLLHVGYGLLPERMIFGTDCTCANISAAAASIVRRDLAIYERLKAPQDVVAGIMAGNLLPFVNGDGRE